MALRRWRGTCNFEASFSRASTNFPVLGLPWGNTQIAGARSTKRRHTHRNVFNSALSHNIGDPYTGSRPWIFWGWPEATYRIPLHLWILDTALRRCTAWFTLAQTSATTCERDAVSTWLQGSKTALLVMLLQIAADSANIATPESEKSFRWVKCGLLTKFCTQSRAPFTSSSQTNIRSRLMMTPFAGRYWPAYKKSCWLEHLEK